MQSKPVNKPPDYQLLNNDGSIATDGNGSPGGSTGDFGDFSGGFPLTPFGLPVDEFQDDIAGFTRSYPTAALHPPPDAPAPAGAAATSEAIGGGSGTSGVIAASTGETSYGEADPSGLVIIADYDSSIAGLPTAEYNNVTGAIAAAIDFYESEITNPITITIDFGVSNLGSGVISDNTPAGGLVSYSTLSNALAGPVTAAGGTLAATDPFNNSYDFYVTNAEREALGLPVGGGAAGNVELSNYRQLHVQSHRSGGGRRIRCDRRGGTRNLRGHGACRVLSGAR